MKRIFSAWLQRHSCWVWHVAFAEGILLVTLYVVIAACAPDMHFTYFVTKLGRALLIAMMLIGLASLLTFSLLSSRIEEGGLLECSSPFKHLLVLLGMIGIAE